MARSQLSRNKDRTAFNCSKCGASLQKSEVGTEEVDGYPVYVCKEGCKE